MDIAADKIVQHKTTIGINYLKMQSPFGRIVVVSYHMQDGSEKT